MDLVTVLDKGHVIEPFGQEWGMLRVNNRLIFLHFKSWSQLFYECVKERGIHFPFSTYTRRIWQIILQKQRFHLIQSLSYCQTGQNLHIASYLSHLYTFHSQIFETIAKTVAQCHIPKTGVEYFQFVLYRRYLFHHWRFSFFLTLCLWQESCELNISETISVWLHVFFSIL